MRAAELLHVCFSRARYATRTRPHLRPTMRAIVLPLFLCVTGCAAEPPPELELDLYSTIHCIGVRIRDVPEPITGARLECRKQGSRRWNKALPLVLCHGNRSVETGEGDETAAAWTDLSPIIRRLHGSIFYLEPDTSYEVRAMLKDAQGKDRGVLNGGIKTRRNDVVYGKGRTLRVGAAAEYKTIQSAVKEAEPGDTVFVSAGVYKEAVTDWPNGDPGNPITLRGEKGAVLDGDGVPAGDGVHAGIDLGERHDIVIEGLRVQRFDYCMFLSGCRNVVVQRNFVDLIRSEPHASYGIRLKGCTDCLVQFNSVQEPGAAEGDYTRYPYSLHNGRGNIIRYNRMLGGCCHDILDARRNSDTDIYENHFRGTTADDGVELEGGTCINLRFWGNVVDNHDGSKVAVSTTPVTVGPLYVLRNVFYAPYQCIKFANDGTANALKAGHKMCDFAPLLFYHNTFYMNPDYRGRHQLFRARLSCHGNLVLMNNIFYGAALPDVSPNLQAGRASAEFGQLKSEYNVLWDGQTTQSANPGLDVHSLFAEPLLLNPAKLDFRLKAGSPGIDAAVRLPNVNDQFAGRGPDIGCFEYGADAPLGVWAPR